MPPKRPNYQRSSKRGQLTDWPEGFGTPDEIAKVVQLRGNTEHKTYPTRFGPPANYADKSKCDQFAEKDWPQLEEALREAIRSGIVGIFRGNFPSRAWVWINETLHEARLENHLLGHYHGYPLDPPGYPASP
jgi:hypothetical protein